MSLPFGLNLAFIIVIALIILICIIGAIFLIAWAFRRPGSSIPVSGPAGGSRTPLQIAQERYARGEINREEYLQIVSDLQRQA